MTFLELVQRLHSEAGMSGATPTTVTATTGEASRAASWIASAYQDIQNMRPDWNFLSEDFSFSTVAGTQTYTPATAGATFFSSWVTDDIRVYLTTDDEQYLYYEPWDAFKYLYLFGSSRTLQQRPSVVSVNTDNSIFLWPIPDATYTINGMYRQEPKSLTVAGDEPVFPVEFHIAIVWRALMYYAGYEGANGVYAHARSEFDRVLNRFEVNQLPQFRWGHNIW